MTWSGAARAEDSGSSVSSWGPLTLRTGLQQHFNKQDPPKPFEA